MAPSSGHFVKNCQCYQTREKEQYNNFGIFANEVVGNNLEYTEILNRFLKFMIVIMHSDYKEHYLLFHSLKNTVSNLSQQNATVCDIFQKLSDLTTIKCK